MDTTQDNRGQSELSLAPGNSTEPRAALGSKYVMATPAQFVKLSEQ